MASVYLDCFENTGKDYLRVLESTYFKDENGKVSNKRKTIKNLGYLEEFDDNKGDGLLLRLREQFKNQTLDIGMSYSELNLKPKKDEIKIKNPEVNINAKNIGYFFLENIFNQLGISDVIRRYKSDNKLDYDVLGLTKLITFGRVLEPKSKMSTFNQNENYLFDLTTSNKLSEIYKTLTVLDEIGGSIQKRMNTKIKQSSVGRISDLTYYDVTNYYFETLYNDEDIYDLDESGTKKIDENGKPIILKKGMRKKGVGKDGKQKPLVAMGLFIDNNGIPVSYNLFPGNTQDKTTLKEIITSSLNKQDLGKVTVVADNGTYAQENMYLLVTKGNGYIVSKSVKAHWKSKPLSKEMSPLREWALDETDYDYQCNKEGVVVFKSKSRIYERTLMDSNGNSIVSKEKQVLFWSRKQYNKSFKENQSFIEYLESCRDNPNKLKDKHRKSQEFLKIVQVDKKTKEIIKTKEVVILLDDKIEKAKEIMGFYSIVTSEIDMDDREIINRYRGLSRIEDSFRIIKSDLEGRPIYVQNPNHINAHFLTCFIALTIIRLIQHRILKYQKSPTLNTEGWKQGITAEKIKETLKHFQVNHIGNGYYQTTKINDELNLIMEALNFKETLVLPSINEIKSYKKKIAAIKL